jgi:hypothetical protein
VQVDGETIPARDVVLAAGAATKRIAAQSGIILPLRLAALDLIGLLGARGSLPFISEHTPGASTQILHGQPAPGWVLAGDPVRNGEGVGLWGDPVSADPIPPRT